VILLDSLLVGGLRFVLGKVAEAVDAERDEEKLLREDLLALQLELELGQVAEAEFKEREAALLRRLRELREAREGPEAGSFKVTGIEAAFTGEEHEAPPRRRRR
jgi:gas vesicle protein GvpG